MGLTGCIGSATTVDGPRANCASSTTTSASDGPRGPRWRPRATAKRVAVGRPTAAGSAAAPVPRDFVHDRFRSAVAGRAGAGARSNPAGAGSKGLGHASEHAAHHVVERRQASAADSNGTPSGPIGAAQPRLQPASRRPRRARVVDQRRSRRKIRRRSGRPRRIAAARCGLAMSSRRCVHGPVPGGCATPNSFQAPNGARPSIAIAEPSAISVTTSPPPGARTMRFGVSMPCETAVRNRAARPARAESAATARPRRRHPAHTRCSNARAAS